jgi:hypothetical protein
MPAKRNNEKGELFEHLISKADLALNNKFYLETSWIVYSIIEERLISVITKIDKRTPGNGFKVDKCLKRLKYLIVKENNELLKRHFELELIDRIRVWKNSRNSTMHDLAKKHITESRIEKLAKEGNQIMRELNATLMRFKKDWKKTNAKNK